MHRDPPRAYFLPRAVRDHGQTSSLQQALRRGANPLALEVEDGAGGWKPYIDPKPGADIADVSKVATPSRRRR